MKDSENPGSFADNRSQKRKATSSSMYRTAFAIKREFKVGLFKLVMKYLFNKDAPIKAVLQDKVITTNLVHLSRLTNLLNNGWQINAATDALVKMSNIDGSNITCRLKSGFDLGHLDEIWVNQVYGSYFRKMNIIDIGASNGDSSIFFAKRGAKRVIAFEPDKKSFALASENIKDSSVEEIVSIHYMAVSTYTGQTKLYVYGKNPNGNSIDRAKMLGIEGDVISEEDIECISLKEVIKAFKGENIDMLKMDCEGCEYSVLGSLKESDFVWIKNVYLEYHNGIQNLPEILKRNGFNCHIIGDTNRMGYIVASRA